ncbi:hypothetical protein [Parvularcula sp. LCG005]|uniref:histidine phosphatase family protein n=1 Tax=Parvularcula sp. LCG005 TaxID=3078805 RepID=UPI002942B6C9|nr:hypothetical protein [Parvularcula sp. LCG005]WOI54640.1 hypothetical protein RUI03_06475 [Parvularcula sp. LCG005]
MTGRIITARHGRPNVDRSVRITAKEYGAWWANYDLSGLAPGEEPPGSLVEAAGDCHVVLSSTLPRAIETAAKIVDHARHVPQDAMFVEAPLPPPPVPFLKLSPTTWGVISRIFWFVGLSPKGVETHRGAWRRVRQIADRLIEHAERGDHILLCAHGYVNWMLDGHLRKRGWGRECHVGDNDYWSWRSYRRVAPDLEAVTDMGERKPS